MEVLGHDVQGGTSPVKQPNLQAALQDLVDVKLTLIFTKSSNVLNFGANHC